MLTTEILLTSLLVALCLLFVLAILAGSLYAAFPGLRRNTAVPTTATSTDEDYLAIWEDVL